LAHLKSKGYKNRTAAIIENGSWGPMAAKHIRTALEGLKDINVIDKTVTIKSTVKKETIGELEELAKELRAALGR
jgi:flavorubredoxin